MKEALNLFLKSIVYSYSAIFFSRSRWFGILLLSLTMLYPAQGVCGLFCCMMVNSMSIMLNLNKYKIETGLYGFNAVLVGIALGAFFTYDALLIALIFALSVLVLLLTIAMDGWLQKYGLPFLAFPFLFCLWLVLLVFQQTDGYVDVNVFPMTTQHALSIGAFSVESVEGLSFCQYLPQPILFYLKSLGYVFFQSDMLSGTLLMLALLCFSRIAFCSTFLGFVMAYFCYGWFEFDIFHIPFMYFGFNFIFTSLALGGCYLVPSKSTYAWILLLIPAQYLVVFSSTRLLSYFMLPTFSLTFCLVSVLFLYLMKRREVLTSPYFSYFLEATPEDNIYYHSVNKERFDYLNYYPFSLPFMGEWKVTQAYDGEYTHQGLWRHALDFQLEIDGAVYKDDGYMLTDYYCYGKPVIAVSSGSIVDLRNNVVDTPIGQKNVEQNWGNYVLIKHTDTLYSLVAHLKTDSVRYKIGDTVRKGDVLGLCGNSGLSPYPHLHFQFQSSSYVGAPTLEYKLSSYFCKNELNLSHPVSAGIPKDNDIVSNMIFDSAMADRYKFIVGNRMTAYSDKFGEETWEVCMQYGYNYLYCHQTGAKAWYAYREEDFCFQRYEGEKRSNLFYFFLSNYRVYFVSEKYQLEEKYPLTLKANTPLGWIQDICSPVFFFMDYNYRVDSMDGGVLRTKKKKKICKKEISNVSFETVYQSNQIKNVKVSDKQSVWNIQINK